MNVLLFEPGELSEDGTLALKDGRHNHIRDVLKAVPGDELSCGMINRSKGTAAVLSVSRYESILKYTPADLPEPSLPFRLIIGLVRPIQAKRIFKTAAVFGIEGLFWTPTALGEKSYARSAIWQDSRKYLIEGASQGGRVRLPSVEICRDIHSAIHNSISGTKEKILFHPGEEVPGIGSWNPAAHKGENQPPPAITAAIGSERGWTEAETELFREMGFELRTLGKAVLRTEDAVTSVLAVLASKSGCMD